MRKDNLNSYILVPPGTAPEAARPPLASIGSISDAQRVKLSHHAEYVALQRKEVFKLRREIGKHVSRVKCCGSHLQKTANGVTIAKNNQSVFYTGLQTCKSVWACPVCSMKISHTRAEEVRNMLTNAVVNQGYKGMFVTLTIPHTAYENLKTLQTIVTQGFSAITDQPAYKGRTARGVFTPGIKQRYQVQGFIRALEVKKKNKGWHPHLHVVFVLGVQEPELLEAFGAEIVTLWASIIKSMSGKVVNEEYGQAVKVINDIDGISDYLNKWDIGKEMTNWQRKISGDSMTPFEIFAWYVKTGSEKHLKEFQHYVLSFHGVNQLTTSKGFKKRFLTVKEKTDAEACNETEIETVLLSMNKKLWKELHLHNLEAHFLNLVQFEPLKVYDYLYALFYDRVYNVAEAGDAPYYCLE